MSVKHLTKFVLIVVFVTLGINLAATKALTQQGELLNLQTKKPYNWKNLLNRKKYPIPSIRFKKAFSWNGCKIGGQLAGGNGRTLSIVLDDMSVADNERKTCFLAIPTALPGNLLMQNVQVLYQGTTENPGGAKTLLRRKYTFVSQSRKKIKLDWVASKFESSELIFQKQDTVTVLPKSCGWQGWLIVGIETRASPQTSLIVDTADLNAGDVKIDINTNSCS